MSDETVVELRRVLSKRHHILELLLEDTYTKPALVKELDHSRSTIDRAIDDLLDLECIERTESRRSVYRGTTFGRLVLQSHREYLNRTNQLQKTSPILTALPSDVTLSWDFLSGAQVYSSKRAPDIAFKPAQELLPDAQKMVGTAPVVFGEYIDVLTNRLRAGGFEMELVIQTSLLETIYQTHSDKFDSLSGFASASLYQTGEQIPYGLWVMDLPSSSICGITFYKEGTVTGTIVNESNDAIDWATEQYDRYKRNATKMSSFAEFNKIH